MWEIKIYYMNSFITNSLNKNVLFKLLSLFILLFTQMLHMTYLALVKTSCWNMPRDSLWHVMDIASSPFHPEPFWVSSLTIMLSWKSWTFDSSRCVLEVPRSETCCIWVGVSLSLTFLRCFKEMQGGNDVSAEIVLCRRE